jgi:hypothetical protein
MLIAHLLIVMANYSVLAYPPHYAGLHNFVTVTISVSWDVCELIFLEDSQNFLPLARLNQVGTQNKLAIIPSLRRATSPPLRATREGIENRLHNSEDNSIGFDNRATLNFYHPVP